MHVITLQGAAFEEPNQGDDGALDLLLLVIFLSSSASLCFPFQRSGAGGRTLSSAHAFPRWLCLRRLSSALSFLLSSSIIYYQSPFHDVKRQVDALDARSSSEKKRRSKCQTEHSCFSVRRRVSPTVFVHLR